MKPIPSVNLPGAVKAAGSYRIPNVKIDSYAVYTNSVLAAISVLREWCSSCLPENLRWI